MLSVFLLVSIAGCTATRTRDFTTEAYEAPADGSPPARVFDASPDAVDRALTEVLRARGARIVERDAVKGSLSSQVPWSSPAEARASVDLGRIRRVIARTERGYRSWSPLHFRCESCVIEKGSLTRQETQLVEDVTVQLDPDRYRLEARLEARTEIVRSGTRLELLLRVDADPRDPPDLAPRSTGRLEKSVFDAITAAGVR